MSEDLVLQDLAEQVRLATSEQDLVFLLRQQVERALHPSFTIVFLADDDGRMHTDDPTVPDGLRNLPGDAPGLAELARRGRPRPVEPEAREPASFLVPLEAECLVPIVGRDAHLLGLAVLGPRTERSSEMSGWPTRSKLIETTAWESCSTRSSRRSTA